MFDLADVLKDVPNLGTTRKELEYLRRDLIDADPNNFYSLDGIDALAANIQLCGLQQPIVVRPAEGGRYVVVSGHRRRAAVELLAAEEPEKWAEVPCLVERDEASPELQQLRLIYANANTRTMTGAELAEQAAQVEKLLYQLKEQGYEFPGRMRDHVAQAISVSKSKLARLNVIRSKLIPQFMRLWEAGSLRESVAYTLAGQVPARQKAVWISQTDSGKKKFSCTDGWLESIFHEMDRLERVCKKTPCGINHSSSCDHLYVRLNQASGLPQYSAMSCRGCCLDCFNLASCRYSCGWAADAKKALRNKVRADREQAAAEQKAKEAPEREAIRQCYQRVGELRAARGISEEDFIRTSQAYVIQKDVERLPKLENGTVSLNDRLPGGLWPAEARRLAAVADMLGCSIDYLLGRTDTPGIVSNLGTGWRTGDPEEPGTYAVIGEDPGSPTQMLERWDWDGKQWTVYGEPVKNYGFQIQCWIPLPPKVGTCITGMSGSGRCGAAAYCAEPVECCLQCDKDCNGRCGWIQEDGNG
mgnify:CR=1 FL=1|nr:MAG TPA: chromosome partitioning protein [Caudoviricetes sp.]